MRLLTKTFLYRQQAPAAALALLSPRDSNLRHHHHHHHYATLVVVYGALLVLMIGMTANIISSRHYHHHPSLLHCSTSSQQLLQLPPAAAISRRSLEAGAFPPVPQAPPPPPPPAQQPAALTNTVAKKKKTTSAIVNQSVTTTAAAAAATSRPPPRHEQEYYLDFVIAGMPKCGTTTLLYALRQRRRAQMHGVVVTTGGDVEIAASERCAIANINLSPIQARQALDQAVHELSSIESAVSSTLATTSSSTIVPASSSAIRRRLRGIKCPTILYSYQTISRIEEYNSYSWQHPSSDNNNNNNNRSSSRSDTKDDDIKPPPPPPPVKFVIGLRHPIELLQSFYNYRVTEVYDHRNDSNNNTKQASKIIPSFDQLMMIKQPSIRGGGGGGRGAAGVGTATSGEVASISWKGVSRDITRFELYLMQFGKTKMTLRDLNEMAKRKNMAVKPGRSKIFLYTLDQIKDDDDDDDDASRSLLFRQALSSFLGLAAEPLVLEPLGHENRNHFVGSNAHPETIDICQQQYNPLRRDLIRQGNKTAQWILHEFLKSQDVFVGNYPHFVATVQSWGTDPCGITPISTPATRTTTTTTTTNATTRGQQNTPDNKKNGDGVSVAAPLRRHD